MAETQTSAAENAESKTAKKQVPPTEATGGAPVGFKSGDHPVPDADAEQAAKKRREEAAEAARLEAVYMEREDADHQNVLKYALYKDFAEGKITRGRLDRELEKLQLQEDQETQFKVERPKTPRQPAAERILSRYEKLSAVSGLVPFPILDMVALSALQVRMIMKLADLYGTSVSEQWVSTTVSTLLGTLAPSYLKAIPGIGTAVGLVTGPAFNYAATHAVGKVFIQQFESGSTIFSLDPAQMKGYFADYFSAARN
jgi:uncharacterized protein (DUF697 family)